MNSHHEPRRIALLGGTFDPLHRGHLQICDHVIEQLEVPVCHLMPCGYPGDKPYVSNREHRIAMLEYLLAETEARLAIERYELDASKPVETVESMRALRAANPEAVIFFVCGRDTYNRMPEWLDYREIAEQVNLAVIDRQCGDDGSWRDDPAQPLVHLAQADLDCPAGQVIRLQGQVDNIASTDIRRFIHEDRERALEWLDACILEYIRREDLYT